MSRGYSKIYNRKLNAASQSSIQFDKLLNENSNRPCASKSSGTLGKWGVISCTSIRSTNLKGRREELGTKRKRAENNNRNAKLAAVTAATSEDPFSFDVDPSQGKVPPSPVAAVVKPKKFFKSRNADAAASVDMSANAPTFAGTGGGSTYGAKKYAKESPILTESAASKKFFVSKKVPLETVAEQTEAMNLSSPTKSPSPPKTEHKPPIVLRIFKGTSHLVNESGKKSNNAPAVAKQSNPNEGGTLGRSTRSTRSTKNYSEIDDCELTSSFESKKSTSTSPARSITESPKKSKKMKVSEAQSSSYEDIVRVAIDYNSGPASPDVGDGSSEEVPEKEAVVEERVPVMKLKVIKERATKRDVTKDMKEAVIIGSQESEIVPLTQDSGIASQSLPSSPPLVSPPDEEMPLASVPADPSEPAPPRDVSRENDEKLLEGDELLASTYVAAEKLVVPQVKTAAEWFSDSEDSSGALPAPVAAAAKLEPGPATKKGSIFKSRSLLSGGSKKRLALYKHKWSDNDKAAAAAAQPSSSQPPCVYTETDEEFEQTPLTRVTSWPMADTDSLDLDESEAITSVKCTKKAKGFYTVVRNVQKAHQIQESGEFQEFNDDVEYILDALQDTFPIGTRCLSAITLASKCMAPAFRMHVRAHGTVAKFFRALHDATKDQSLGLCTATVMFVLSQDRLNMDLDRHSLELMLNLLESDASHRNALDDCGLTNKQLHKNKQKVRELCAEIQSQGHAKHLNLDNITVGHLAMETLLSLTSRRAGEWFKEELRDLGGLEHIVNTVCDCCRQVDDYVVQWTDPLLEKLRKIDRCLRVLENVTYLNEENQAYLLRFSDGVLLDTLVKLFRQCDSEVPLYPVADPQDKESTGAVIREVLLATLKVLINLTHDFNNKSFGSALAGQRKGIIDASLHILLQVPTYVPDEKKFDMLVLALILLINLVEHCQPNRQLLFEARAPPHPENVFHCNDKSAVEALIELFHQQEQHARNEEMKTDAILDGKKDTEQPEAPPEKPKSQEEFIEETVAKLLQKAGRNMEHTLVSAYVGLLLGFVIMDNPGYELYVRQCFPDKTFATMVAVLQKVYNFMNLTASAVGSSRGIAQTQQVINFMSKSDSLAASQASTLHACL